MYLISLTNENNMAVRRTFICYFILSINTLDTLYYFATLNSEHWHVSLLVTNENRCSAPFIFVERKEAL